MTVTPRPDLNKLLGWTIAFFEINWSEYKPNSINKWRSKVTLFQNCHVCTINNYVRVEHKPIGFSKDLLEIMCTIICQDSIMKNHLPKHMPGTKVRCLRCICGKKDASASILYLQLCHQCVITYCDQVQSLCRIYICRVWSHVAIKRKNLHMQSVMEAITPEPLPWSLTSVRGPGHPPAKSCLVSAG